VIGVQQRPHASGRLVDCLVLAADPLSPQRLDDAPAAPWEPLSAADFATRVQQGGLVGMGGAAFPTHVKYALPEGRRVERLVANGCECEPYLTADHRVMVERAAAVVRGTQIVAARLGVREAVIAVEANKPDAAAALEAAAQGTGVRVATLAVKYPQGAEKMLLKALFDLEVPPGKLPLDVGCLVNNVGTLAALADWLDRGVPLVERVVTVAGPGVARPANLLVPIGTPVSALLAHCGLLPGADEVVLGGPMMGTPIASAEVPVTKGTSGVLVFRTADRAEEQPCIRCGRCLDACPQLLNPSRLGRLAKAGRWEDMEPLHVFDCVECGSCSFSCPSGIPIVQLVRVAKAALRDQQAREKAKAS
jgi:electron transport complex protein RnfC